MANMYDRQRDLRDRLKIKAQHEKSSQKDVDTRTHQMNLQKMQNDGRTGVQQLRNKGGASIQQLRNKGALKNTALSNEGRMGVESLRGENTLRNTDSLNRGKLGQEKWKQESMNYRARMGNETDQLRVGELTRSNQAQEGLAGKGLTENIRQYDTTRFDTRFKNSVDRIDKRNEGGGLLGDEGGATNQFGPKDEVGVLRQIALTDKLSNMPEGERGAFLEGEAKSRAAKEAVGRFGTLSPEERAKVLKGLSKEELTLLQQHGLEMGM